MLTLDKKLNKRKEIAKSTCSLFIEKGYVNISISEIAKNAQIGKGTVYEYFKNKEDIVFELMSCLQDNYDNKLKDKLSKTSDIKEKIFCLFDIFLSDDKTILIQKKIYREFLAIYLNNPTQEIIEYQNIMKDKYYKILEKIFLEAINDKIIILESKKFISSVFATIEGYFISNASKDEIMDYIDNLLSLLEYKKGKI